MWPSSGASAPVAKQSRQRDTLAHSAHSMRAETMGRRHAAQVMAEEEEDVAADEEAAAADAILRLWLSTPASTREGATARGESVGAL